MKKDLIILLLLILPSFSVLLQPGYFPMHDDLQTTRQLEMDKCFADGQIPCRWVLDMGYGYGYPLFNFYPPLPYLIGQIYRTFDLAYVDIVKLVGVTGFILTAVFMYVLGKEIWGRPGGILSSLVYTYAPYHSVDFYVRGAVNEFWAMAFFPAILYTSYKLIKTKFSKYILLLALSTSGLMLSHNLMLMVFAPLAVLWCLFWLWQSKSFSIKQFTNLSISATWALGLSAFFTIPVLFEQKFAHVETLIIGYFNFLAHYLDLKQIFLNINWGYGESRLGPADTMSFAIGYLQWLLPAAVVVLSIFYSRLKRHFSLIAVCSLCVLIPLFLSHSKSTPIWQMLRPLQFLQFPWRLLSVVVFFLSFISGAIALVLRKKVLLIVLINLIILMNYSYFRPRTWFSTMTDAEKFSGKSWVWQVTGSIFDYLPIWAPMPPADPAGGDIGLINGTGTYSTIAKKTNYQQFTLDITSPQAIAQIQTFYFPGWRVWLDGVEQTITPSDDKLLGRMEVGVPSGSHTLVARFTNTPIRSLGNFMSVVSLVGVFIFFLKSLWIKRLTQI